MKYLILSIALLAMGCQQDAPNEVSNRPLAKFEPSNNKVLVFAGQDLASLGGMPEYSNGYSDYFPVPFGITLYTGIGGNDGSFGGQNTGGLHGIYETVDHGNGPSNMALALASEVYENAALAIGLSLVNNEEKVANGELDDNILKLGEFLLSLEDRPVFLRIGYEFDGDPWNHYDRPSWIKAYKRIKDKLDAMGVTNTAYVWQSVGWVSDQRQLEAWYPGDDYVDWCAFSFFDRWKEVEMIAFARKKGKPAFIAESSATISDFTAKFTGQTKPLVLSNPEHAQEAFDYWFTPYFDMIENNSDVIKALHYIDTDWKNRPMWFENPTFQKVDARIELSPLLTKFWNTKMAEDRYINAADNFSLQNDNLNEYR